MHDASRIMIYSQDSYGLGHLRRTTNLANSLAARREDITILLIVDSPVAPFFELHERIDFVKLPTVVKVDAGVFEPGRLVASYELIKQMRMTMLREIAMQFRPDLVLVDHMPGGANRELVPTLDAIRRNKLPTKLVLGLRDIIDRPEVTCEVWEREGVYDTIEQYYDSVLIYGSDEVYATAEHYRLPPAISDRVSYCGYVCNMDPCKEPERIRDKLGLDDEPIVAAMAGGGADAYVLMQNFVDAVEMLRTRRRFASLMVTGPFMPDEQRKALREQAKAMNVNVHTSIGDTMSHLNAADVVVTMAGYNTLVETMRFQKRTIVVPRPGPSAEQSMRADLFERRGLVTTLAQSQLSPRSLADRIDDLLAAPDHARDTLPGLDGVARATEVLLASLPAPRNGVDVATYRGLNGVAAPVVATMRPSGEVPNH